MDMNYEYLPFKPSLQVLSVDAGIPPGPVLSPLIQARSKLKCYIYTFLRTQTRHLSTQANRSLPYKHDASLKTSFLNELLLILSSLI